jgi:hypothetical protein
MQVFLPFSGDKIFLTAKLSFQKGSSFGENYSDVQTDALSAAET